MSEPPNDLLGKRPQEFLRCLMKRDEDRQQSMGRLFARELTVVDRALEVQFQGFQTFHKSGDNFNFPVQQLLPRLFNNQLAARKLLLMGYITEVASILARALETIWLARCLDCCPDLIDRWWKNSKQGEIRPYELRDLLKHATNEGKIQIGDVDSENRLYAALCEIGHPNYVGSIQHVNLVNESPPQVEFRLGGYGKLEKGGWLEKAFRWLIHIQLCSLITMAAVSKGFLGNNKGWMQDCSLVLEDLGNVLK